MSYSLFENKVFLFLTNSHGEYLFLEHNHEGSIIKGYVNPPAGHLEVNETIPEAVIWEAEEEMGITKVEQIQLRGTINVSGFKDNPILIQVVTAKVPDSELPQEKDEGRPVWIETNKLEEYTVFEDIAHILDLLNKTPLTNTFHAKSVFKNKQLISFVTT